ncbi:hypothetical protein [Aminobacter carboxidus]|uniref:hypothetical protein n=1 Tax=Aminobacter carboxidus TaxID=376165 RepID=UPI003EB7C48A
MPRANIVATTPNDIPYLKPVAVLLFKAKYQRPKDEANFENALPKLQRSERAWLKDCLDMRHPGHEWTGLF